MKKIDRRINYYLSIDTECPYKEDNTSNKPYNVGFVVTDKKGRIYERFNYVIVDVFYDTAIMEHASNYKKNKLIENFPKVYATTVLKKVHQLMEEYSIKKVIGFYIAHDKNALDNLAECYTEERRFFPKDTIFICTRELSCQLILNRPTYKMFCEKHKKFTKNGNPRTNAETVYQYILGDAKYKSEHTALKDAEREAHIFAYCMRQHKKYSIDAKYTWFKVFEYFKK